MPGPVGAWMGDHLGQVNHLGAEQPGLVRLSQLSVGRRIEYPAKAGEVNRHTT